MRTIIFKPTEKCNSNCIYCDVVANKAPETMSYDILELVFIKINEFLEANPDENIVLIWHGGEPCLLGVEYFKKAWAFQDKHCSQTKSRVRHSIQTNLTLITQELLDIFKQMNIRAIGTSFEPIPGIRGFGKNRDSEKYNRLFMKGINLLKENNMGWSFIYVVTKKSLQRPLDIFYFLTNLELHGSFLINPVLVYGKDSESLAVSPLEYADFLGKIFPVWWEHKERFPGVNPFKAITKNIIDKEVHLFCGDSGGCAYSHTYIGPGGEASHCGRSGDWGILSYGNIKERSLMDIFEDQQREQLAKRDEILLQTECKDCRFWQICHGGCPLDAYNKHKDFMHKSEWSTAKKIFIEKYFEPITGVKAEFAPDHKSDDLNEENNS